LEVIVKKIYVITIVLLVAMMVLTAAVPKPGPKVVLTLVNKMVNAEASLSLSGLTNFYTYYLTAKAYDIQVKYPSAFSSGVNWSKSKNTSYEVRADMYETTVYDCGGYRSGTINLTRNVKLVFPLCDKADINQGEPTQEKLRIASAFPGYYDPYRWDGAANTFTISTVGNSDIYGRYVGDGYNDGTTKGSFDLARNGAQIHWALDFYNYYNGGADVWH
jgi:hypothetical protein